MGMFDEKRNEKQLVDNDNHSEIDTNIDVDENLLEVDKIDPEELANSYIEAVLACNNEDEVANVMLEFFEAISAYTVQEIYLADIQAKIQALNMIKQGLESE